MKTNNLRTLSNRILLIFCMIMILASCQDSKTIYEEHQSFGEAYEWAKKDKKTFVIDVKENSHPVQMTLALRYASGYMYDTALLKITETDPEGNKISRDVDVRIRDEKGEFIGEKGYDIIDLEMVLDEKKVFPVFGKYTYEIEQTMPEIDPLIFVMEIGLIVRDESKN
jgi:gliding motility-associated lipoprotein GldH